jgi:hypothetical protein
MSTQISTLSFKSVAARAAFDPNLPADRRVTMKNIIVLIFLITLKKIRLD